MEVSVIAKGYLKNPVVETIECQYCGEEYTYTRVVTNKRKNCITCVPEGRGADISYIRRILKKKMVEERNGECFHCKIVSHPSVYDFHHINPSEKSFSFGDKASTIRWDLIKKEMEKCVMLCSNCHRLLHAGVITLDAVNGVE